MRISPKKRKALELEVVPAEARLELTRIIRGKCLVIDGDDDGGIALVRENEFVNIANQVMGKPIYVLEGGGWGEYHPAEHAWHHGQRELVMRLPSTPELAEILADYLQRGMMGMKQVNGILRHYNCGFSFEDEGGSDDVDVSIQITADDAIPNADLSKEHPNVRMLVARMDAALDRKDYAAVLHASASVFETLAKEIINKPSVSDETLGGIFDSFRKRSNLPEPILDYILKIYKDRNSVPLAGHGSLSAPTVDAKDAVTLCEFTKFVVRTERSLAEQKVDLSRASSPLIVPVATMMPASKTVTRSSSADKQ